MEISPESQPRSPLVHLVHPTAAQLVIALGQVDANMSDIRMQKGQNVIE